MNIIESLYNGELNPFENSYHPTKEFLSAFRVSSTNEDKLLKLLTDESLTLFNEYIEANNNINYSNNLETFSIGFRLGAQLMMDILNHD